jgi:hypothetical protein
MMSDHNSRNIYLEDIPREQAWERFLQAWHLFQLKAYRWTLPWVASPQNLSGRVDHPHITMLLRWMVMHYIQVQLKA